MVIGAGETLLNAIALTRRIGIPRWFLRHVRFLSLQRSAARRARGAAGREAAPLHYGALFSTTYWKHLFGLPVVWK